ncbi:MAG: PAS domain S-box protein, partial [Dongiaceae bacterium]
GRSNDGDPMAAKRDPSRARRLQRAPSPGPAPDDREARFRAAAEAALDAFFILDCERDRNGRTVDFVFAFLNGVGERLLGLSRDRVVGTKLSETIPCLRGDAFFDEYVRVAESGTPFEREFANTTPEIRAEWLHQRAVPVPGGIAITMRDIGDRKQMQAALGESDARYRSLYNDAPVMLHSIDRDGRLVRVSDVWLRTLGYEREEAIGRKSIEFLTEASRRHAVETVLPEFMQTGVYRDAPYQFVKKNGEIVDVLLSATAERDADGRVARSIAVMIDVTERKKAEAALRATETRLQALIDYAPAVVFLKDLEGRYLLINREFEKVHGVTDAAVRGRTADEVFPGAGGDAVTDHDREVLRILAPRQREMDWPCPDGTRTFIVTKFPVLGADGAALGLGCVELDITERRRAEAELRIIEARLQALADNSPTRIFMKDRDGRYLFANREFEKFYGLSAAHIRGKTAHEVFPRAEAEIYTEHDREVLRTLAPVERETAWQAADGLQISSEVKFPIFDENGTAVGVGCIETDITERKRAEEALRAAKETAEQANRAKSDFLANMSHELRTPLNAILGFSETIATELFGPIGQPRYASYARDIHASGTHLLAIINDILDLSKIEAGRYEIRPEPVETAALVDDCLRIVSGQAAEQGVALSARVDPALPPLHLDPRAAKQILLDLLSNALKFTPAGGAVTVAVERLADGGATLRVADTGIGIAAEDIPRILTPFVQVESTMTRQHAGTGLGLPIAKALAEMHGGEMSIESTPGHGTTVSLRFGPSRVLVAATSAA